MKKPEILVLYGGAPSKHVLKILKQFKEVDEPVAHGNYRKLTFKAGGDVVGKPKLSINGFNLDDFKVIFFRSIGNRWEKVNLIALYLKERIEHGKVKIIDPLVIGGSRYPSMKVYQMFAFQSNGLPVPKTIFGDLSLLKEKGAKEFGFPFIIKRSEGGRGERVYQVKNQQELDSLIKELTPQEKEEKKTFLAQEFIANQGDLRLLVLGGQVLGTMKRVRRKKGEFRNNVSLGGQASVVKASPELEQMALKAAKITQTSLAGVDIVLRHPDNKPFLLEVNRAPQFKGFVKATGINVPLKIVQFLVKLKKEVDGQE